MLINIGDSMMKLVRGEELVVPALSICGFRRLCKGSAIPSTFSSWGQPRRRVVVGCTFSDLCVPGTHMHIVLVVTCGEAIWWNEFQSVMLCDN